MGRGRYKSRATRASEQAGAWQEVASKMQDAVAKEDLEAAKQASSKFSYDEFEALKEEMESWRDNMSGTNLESTQKFQDVSDCCDALDQISADSLGEEPDSIEDAEQKADDIEQAASELESVEFPGMY